ncbi:hypothetical protein V496_05974 [Pseudogymnoascus sp. VKM F-4515 (FW-2607)]|nr:hypothetical protein V496_05974 [Pseudogymnoascus sp. VKM F-4515 (FW-2607)]
MNPPDTLCLRDLFVIVTLVDAYYVDPELARPICVFHDLSQINCLFSWFVAITGELQHSHQTIILSFYLAKLVL